MSMYTDKTTCPKGHEFKARRRIESSGRIINTFCPTCNDYHQIMAGPIPPTVYRSGRRKGPPTRESQIETELVKRVLALGGEVRKVSWVGRKGAPDRLVMLPPMPYHSTAPIVRHYPITIWVELKAPGGKATFPKNAHERAQHREHERMRKMGQRVEVVDSYEGILEILK